MLCLIIAVVGVATVARMPVDLFPDINIPVVVVATFYNGMPPEQIESNITDPLRALLHAGQRHRPHRVAIADRRQPDQESTFSRARTPTPRSAPSRTWPWRNLRRLPPGTLPPVVLKFDASSLPVCLITLKGEGLNETQLHDLGQFNVATRSRMCPALPCRSRSAASTARSRSTSIRSSLRRTS